MARVRLLPLLPFALLLAAAPVQDEHGVPLPAADAPPLPFQSVQPELFGVAGSLSNAWGDFDGDGDADLAVSLKSGEVRLYRNDHGTFVTIGAAMGLPTKGYELRGLSWGDYDGDGWLDLLGGATDPKTATLVFHNLGGRKFEEVGAAIGLGFSGRSARQTSWVDFDKDGELDVYAADRIGPNKLFANNGGRFAQILAGEGITGPRPTVGACWFDYDEDGDLDLFLANQSGAADALWRNDDGHFTDVAVQAGVAGPPRTSPVNAGDHGVQWVDYDGDGALDLSITDGYGPVGGHFVFHNTSPKSVAARSLQVLVLDAKGHFTRAGAEVRLRDTRGKLLATRQLGTGDGYNTQSALPVHFGLTSLVPVTVEVTFLTAKGRVTQTIRNVDPRRYAGTRLVVRQAAKGTRR